MSRTHLTAERVIEAPADVVYHCLADYREHHRPGGFLPEAFSDFRVERGGFGAGTVISFTLTLGGHRRTMTQQVSEPRPGRVLVETGPRVRTTFSVEPEGDGEGEGEGARARVRFDTVLAAGGLDGLLIRLFAPRLLKPLYVDELARLEQCAQAHLATGFQPDHRHPPPVTA